MTGQENRQGKCVVVAEDDPNICELISMYFGQEGWRVVATGHGEDVAELVIRESPEILILDVSLKGAMSGFEVCRAIRAKHSLPILMLTARDTEIDRILGLELGADDYVVKPFSPRELVARVKAILRRTGPADRQAGSGTGTGVGARAARRTLSIGAVEIDTGSRIAKLRGSKVELTSQEFDLLVFLFENKGLALSRRQILDGAWTPGWYGDERTVDVHVRQLRRKYGDELTIATVWGVGYRLDQ